MKLSLSEYETDTGQGTGWYIEIRPELQISLSLQRQRLDSMAAHLELAAELQTDAALGTQHVVDKDALLQRTSPFLHIQANGVQNPTLAQMHVGVVVLATRHVHKPHALAANNAEFAEITNASPDKHGRFRVRFEADGHECMR